MRICTHYRMSLTGIERPLQPVQCNINGLHHTEGSKHATENHLTPDVAIAE